MVSKILLEIRLSLKEVILQDLVRILQDILKKFILQDIMPRSTRGECKRVNEDV